MARRILVIEDQDQNVSEAFDPHWLRTLDVALETCRWTSVNSANTLPRVDILVAVASSTSRQAFVSLLNHSPRHTPLLAVVGDEIDSDGLADAARRGDDFMIWRAGALPELWWRLERLLGSRQIAVASRNVAEAAALAKIVGRDPHLTATLSRVPIVARSAVTVLIVGETGTGKELCARAIHHLSSRRNQPFIPIDCGALPEQLLENELFGHTRGAFTDAHQNHRGLVALAQGGTLFLDEIDSLAQPAQAKILRLLEARTYRPLGGSTFEQADVRIVAATSACLDRLVHDRKFRADLFYRLNVVQLVMPPLRDRRGDIGLLAQHFIDRICAESQIPPKALAPAAAQALTLAPWPGNVRELFNVVQNAVLFCEGPVILTRHLAIPQADGTETTEEPLSFTQAKSHAVCTFERAYLETLLRKHAGNITRCALEAKKDRRAFGRLVKKHRLDRRAI